MASSRSVRAAAVAAVLTGVIGLGAVVPATSAGPTEPVQARSGEVALEVFEDDVLAQVNAARTAEGLKPVEVATPCVQRMASRWSARIARTGVLEHRAQSVVIRRCRQSWAGETLIRGSELTPESMVAAWMDSPDHRAILMSSQARLGAVAVAIDGQDRMVGVINMARPSRRSRL